MFKRDHNVTEKLHYLALEVLFGMEFHVSVKLKVHVYLGRPGMVHLVSVLHLVLVLLVIINMEILVLVHQILNAHLDSLGMEDIV